MLNTQCGRIVQYMQTHGGITQFEAIGELGVLRLASRIHDLKDAGYSIRGETVTVKNRYNEKCRVKRYRLEEGAQHGKPHAERVHTDKQVS